MNIDELQFLEDFEWAEVRLATVTVKGKKGSFPVFSTVRLLPKGRSRPAPMLDVDTFTIRRNIEKLYYRRIVMTAYEAIKWYRSLDKDPQTPIPYSEEDKIRGDGTAIVVEKLIDDPVWPVLGLPVEDTLFYGKRTSHPSPFVGNTSARIHRRFGSQTGFMSFLENDDAIDFITKRLNINLKEYPEYLGSFALIVLDPIIKNVENFLISDQDEEHILYRFVPRPGKTLEGLKLTTFDEQSNLLTNFDTIDIPINGIVNIRKGTCVGKYGYVVTHPIHGILTSLPPSSFLRSMNFNMGIVNEIRDVRVPIGESPNSPESKYTVNKVSNEKKSTFGENKVPINVNIRVGRAAALRDNKVNGKNADQKWFGKNSRHEAMNFIRSKIGRAKSRVMIADPYFGVLQMPQFLLAVNSDSVGVEIFTSRLTFENKNTPEQATEIPNGNLHTSKLDVFRTQLEEIKKEINLKVNVLAGKKPELHDRFLVVDDDVWFMGNSLNTLGDRASMIIKLPDPDSVLEELASIHKKSESFDSYYKKRKALNKGDK
ncbi:MULTISPECIES: VPA1262 family N-terminal domain-containing protein [unclassified Colwellia]|jgi:hypothetical protein|uniref:VPA1262 family N-terminal domain-containing protein n=1 Tax=unclassified Colwellia TaxID=196834 RepID=UPI0015F4B33B|nr:MULTISPECIES: VPA1262 family N-terminal domain-containing protein [unclassified Colwellia]MBA6256437.1 hypothetical protein [Colwellia sp. MB3u-28]MBA6260360.1 hypothetical protein [Colwellia sp. MB3u-41]